MRRKNITFTEETDILIGDSLIGTEGVWYRP